MPAARIKVLSREDAQRIAAGEVIERPASVVKELVENSIDAQARRIEVEIEAGGKELIRVGDDGVGMVPEDALSCFKRHATSKIDRFDDLELIHTYGFRGEAMPSIGAVSRVRLLTRYRGQPNGVEVVYEFGKLVRSGEAGSPEGTDIVIRELFRNLPARKKFLKSNRAEQTAIVEIVSRQALVQPRIAFHLLANGRTVLNLAPATELQRIENYFGSKSKEPPLALDYESPGVGKIHGGIWHPNHVSRGNRGGILVFVNGRPITNRLITEAVVASCRGITMGHRFPQGVVMLQVPGTKVDVNVHPTKAEIKFADEPAIRKLVIAGITKALADAGVDLMTTTPLGSGEPLNIPAAMPAWDEPFPVSQKPAPASNTAPFEVVSTDPHPTVVPPPRRAVIEPPRPTGSTGPQLNFTPEAALPLYEKTPYTIQGQFANTFILVEHGDRLLVIDQHTAHERVIYEELLAHDAEHPAASQELLLPPLVRLSATQAARVAELLPLLATYGFRVETSGADSFRVHSVPEMVSAGDEGSVAEEVLLELGQLGEDTPLARLKHETRATISCKAAVKAGDKLSREVMATLVRRLLASPNKSTCPHGRPTTAELTEAQIRRWFKRT